MVLISNEKYINLKILRIKFLKTTKISPLENNNILIITSFMFSALLFLTPFLIPYFISKSLSYYDEKKILENDIN
jgi:hypothetical protein